MTEQLTLSLSWTKGLTKTGLQAKVSLQTTGCDPVLGNCSFPRLPGWREHEGAPGVQLSQGHLSWHRAPAPTRIDAHTQASLKEPTREPGASALEKVWAVLRGPPVLPPVLGCAHHHLTLSITRFSHHMSVLAQLSHIRQQACTLKCKPRVGIPDTGRTEFPRQEIPSAFVPESLCSHLLQILPVLISLPINSMHKSDTAVTVASTRNPPAPIPGSCLDQPTWAARQ